MEMTALGDTQEPSAKNMCLIEFTSLHQNHIYADLPPCLLGAVSQSYLKHCLQTYSHHSAPNKT